MTPPAQCRTVPRIRFGFTLKEPPEMPESVLGAALLASMRRRGLDLDWHFSGSVSHWCLRAATRLRPCAGQLPRRFLVSPPSSRLPRPDRAISRPTERRSAYFGLARRWDIDYYFLDPAESVSPAGTNMSYPGAAYPHRRSLRSTNPVRVPRRCRQSTAPFGEGVAGAISCYRTRVAARASTCQ